MSKFIVEALFQRYIGAFERHDIEAVQSCYQLPCTLHTPDKAVLINDNVGFTNEFSEIFAVLSDANIEKFKATKATYSEISPQLLLVCIDWQFIAKDGDIFTDFSAFYHIGLMQEQWKIVNVVSQEMNQSKTLENPFDITR